jgi:transcriptional regulator with XRE-family HTH domain
MNLHDDLKKKVEAAGFSMTEVCNEAGVSSGTPSHWRSRSSPNQKTYDKLVDALYRLVDRRAHEMREAGIN